MKEILFNIFWGLTAILVIVGYSIGISFLVSLIPLWLLVGVSILLISYGIGYFLRRFDD